MVWQHFANIGGHDKDRMVNIMMFLSPLLFATIGYAYTKQDKVAAMIGVFTSLIAVVVVLMYSGYADRNWSHADHIAETYLDKVNLKGVNEREGVVNNPLSWELKPQRFYDCGRFGLWVHKLAAFLSRPHDPQKSLAPIFQLFLVLSVITALVSLDLWVGWLPYLRQVFSFNNTEMLKPVTDIVVNVMNNTEMLKSITDIVVNLFTVLAIVVGAVWARYKFWEFRESKFWVKLWRSHY